MDKIRNLAMPTNARLRGWFLTCRLEMDRFGETWH